MKKLNLFPTLAVALSFSFLAAVPSVFAQTTVSSSNGTVPMLYSQPLNGAPVNNGNTTALPAGTYYLSSGQPVYYYGNGTYYNSSTQTYGGSTNDPYGTAGNYAPGSIVPTVPSTGFGGSAVVNWMILLVSAMVCMASLAYGVTRSTSSVNA